MNKFRTHLARKDPASDTQHLHTTTSPKPTQPPPPPPSFRAAPTPGISKLHSRHPLDSTRVRVRAGTYPLLRWSPALWGGPLIGTCAPGRCQHPSGCTGKMRRGGGDGGGGTPPTVCCSAVWLPAEQVTPEKTRSSTSTLLPLPLLKDPRQQQQRHVRV